jgi:hypothetical protein
MDTNDARFLRGLAIARGDGIRQLRRQVWSVKSATHAGSYLVDVAGETPACTCEDWTAHGELLGRLCKHAWSVLIRSKKIEIPSGLLMSNDSASRPTCARDWHAYDQAQQHERDHFTRLLRALCGGIVAPMQTNGRPRKAPADVVSAIVLKVYTRFSGRRVISDLRAAQEAGDIEETLSPKSISRYMESEATHDLLRELIRESAAPLVAVERTFAIDSSGFSSSSYDRWVDIKYGRTQKRQRWVKAHMICGAATHVVTDVIVADGNSADCPMLPELVSNTAQRFTMTEVCADKAYLSHRNFDAIERVGATPYVPFKIGNTGDGPALWKRMWALYTYKQPEWAAAYHARSQSESVFSMVKAKFGANVLAKSLAAQKTEVLAKFLAHNICCLIASMHELGIAAEFGGNRDGGGHAH